MARKSAGKGKVTVSETTIAIKKEVVHSTSRSRASTRRSTTTIKTSASNSPTSRSRSMASTPREDLSDYETPGTTPALSIAGPSGTKRKREIIEIPESEDATYDDEALALQLQEQEYANETLKKVKYESESDTALSEPETVESEDYKPIKIKSSGSSSKKKTIKYEESDSELSEPETVDSDIPLAIKKSAGKAKKMGRAAAAAAKAIVRSTLENAIQLDGSEVDEGEVKDESAFEDEDETEDETGDGTESEAGAAAPSASTAAASTGRRHGNINAAGAQRIANQLADRLMTRMERRMLDRKRRERKKLEKAHPGIKTMWKDLEQVEVIKPNPAPQPASINRKLKIFQLEGLNWLIRQEQSQYRGGLLGDEMGMGKTIQAVSLIMSDYPQNQPSLVVVPPVALMQWSSEIADYTDGKLKVLVYHGTNSKIKAMKVKDLKQYDVIMISYNSLESLHRKETKGWSRGDNIVKEDSPIHAIDFHRLILDEAHCIKTRTTGVAKACFALKGTYKWCLSGTPVQNRIGEFFSLLRFLEVRPFADYFCKKCPCALLHWKLDESHNCEECGHTGMEHVSVFNQELLNPLTQSENQADRSSAMAKLHLITARIMLRRLKKDHTSSMELPPKEVVVSSNFFGDVEKDFSTSIMSNSERKFNTYVSQHVVLNNYANIFGLIMQMRQVANHPDLLLKKHAQEGQNVLSCQLCDEVAEDAIRSQCKHDFCRSCVKEYISTVEKTGATADCPRCHIALAIDLDQPEIEQDEDNVKKSSIINRIKMEDWTSSTKIEMLVYELYKLRSKKQTTKSIVFSNFTSMLQLVEWRLRRAGFNTVMLDGSMSPTQRQRSIEYFMSNPTVEVFLVSLKAGGVALNLTEASRVFIIDPWWNPAAEWQSADRCHRIGQRRPCVITRLVIEDSVESRMVMLQEKKANMINSTINNDKASFDKLTPEDMQFLFRGS